MTLSSVLLPEPLSPVMAAHAPGSTVRSTPRSTGSGPAGLR